MIVFFRQEFPLFNTMAYTYTVYLIIFISASLQRTFLILIENLIKNISYIFFALKILKNNKTRADQIFKISPIIRKKHDIHLFHFKNVQEKSFIRKGLYRVTDFLKWEYIS